MHKAIPRQDTTEFYDASMPRADNRSLTTKITSLIALCISSILSSNCKNFASHNMRLFCPGFSCQLTGLPIKVWLSDTFSRPHVNHRGALLAGGPFLTFLRRNLMFAPNQRLVDSLSLQGGCADRGADGGLLSYNICHHLQVPLSCKGIGQFDTGWKLPFPTS